MNSTLEPKRVKNFRLEMAKRIPRSPNNGDTLRELAAMDLTTLLVHYSNWVSRFIRPRKRAVRVEPEVIKDRRWIGLAPEINSFLDKVRRGEDITAHLSTLVSRKGYVGKSLIPPGDKWRDKDLLLNVMGYHHFHLSSTPVAGRQNERTDDVLFAQITRDAFSAIGIFDHSVFKMVDALPATLNAERERLWNVFENRNSQGRPPGVYIQSLITTSGHTYWQSSLSMQYARTIYQYDEKLEDQDYVAEIFLIDERRDFGTLKPVWALDFLDLCILEEKSKRKVVLKNGPF